MRKIAVLKFGLSLFAASILGLGGAIALHDTALAASRTTKHSSNEHGSSKQSASKQVSAKRKCKVKGVRQGVSRKLCRKPRSAVKPTPTPAPAGLCDGREQLMCIQIYKPVHIITEEGCRTFGNSCMLAISQEFCGQQLDVKEGACPK